MSWRSQLKTDTPARLLALVEERAQCAAVVRLTRPIAWSRDRFDRFLRLHAELGRWTYTTTTTRHGVDVAELRMRPGG